MTFRTDPESISRQVAELGTQRSGLLGDLLRQTRGSIPPGYHATLVDYVQMVEGASSQMTQHVGLLFKTLRAFLEEHVPTTHSSYAQQIRIVPNLRRQPGWTQVEVAWDNLSNFTSGIAEAMVKLADGLTRLVDYDIEEYDDLLATISATARHLTELHQRLNEIVVEPDHNAVYWVELQPDGGRMSLHAAPLDVGPLVRKHLWDTKEAVIMTSATLRTDGTFDFMRERLDASDIEEVVIDTPFDYKNSALLYIASDMPEPSDQAAYQSAVERGILELCRATQGRALVLFTSYAQLRATASAISDALAQHGIAVYDQSDGTSRSQLLEGFVQSEKSVLMGTRSFWEGVDIPGPDLSVLVIVRLPFNVPSDPLFAARSELFDDSFQQYALPETILRFRQGFGRLIRRRTDRGVVAIFDRRVISKPYGQMFLNSLPECTRRVGRLIDLPTAAVEWLGRTNTVADAPF
jgi:DNA polymerase-3 subunit epsilon/ATP-dependent DNA helicase DinG